MREDKSGAPRLLLVCRPGGVLSPSSRPPSSLEVRMLRWFQALMPREERFFDLYNRHAKILVQGALALRELLAGGPAVADAARKIFALEEEADAIAYSVLLL